MMQTSDASNIVCGHCGGLVKGSCCWMAGKAYHNSCYSLLMGVERGLASVIGKDARITAIEAERDRLDAYRIAEHAEHARLIAELSAERDQLLARIEDTDSACADYAFAGAHTAREIIEKLHDRIRGYKTDRDLLAEANDQLRAENARLIAPSSADAKRSAGM